MNAQSTSFAMFRAQQWVVLIAAVISIVITASLGAWQLRRAAFKEQLAQSIFIKNAQLAGVNTVLNAIDLGAYKPDDWLHRRMELQGRWLHEYTVFLDNRPMGVSGSQRVGFYVATPLAIEGGNKVIWVQRGWVQRDFQDRNKLPVVSETTELVSVRGRLIANVSKAYEMSGNPKDAAQTTATTAATSTSTSASQRPSRIWQNVPVVNLSSKELLPMALLQTAAESGKDGLLRDWPAADTGVAKHYGYAFQWFALSALSMVLYVWFQIIAPRRKHAAQNVS